MYITKEQKQMEKTASAEHPGPLKASIQRSNCEGTARFGATPEHIARVRAGFNGLRIRPEDVAAIIPQWRKDGKPLAFNVVDVERKSIANQALTCCSEGIDVDPAQLNAVAAPQEEKATVEGMSESNLPIRASDGPDHAGDD